MAKRFNDPTIDALTEAIERNPSDFSLLVSRAACWLPFGRYAAAVSDCDTVIRICPDVSEAYYVRATARFRQARYERAVGDYSSAIRLGGCARYYLGRGASQEMLERYDEALRDYETALLIDPGDGNGLIALAGFLAACPIAHLRDGARARTLAEQSLENCHRKDWRCFAAAAAAHAELGRFDDASELARRAIELAPPKEKAERKRRLDLYTMGKPYRRGSGWIY